MKWKMLIHAASVFLVLTAAASGWADAELSPPVSPVSSSTGSTEDPPRPIYPDLGLDIQNLEQQRRTADATELMTTVSIVSAITTVIAIIIQTIFLCAGFLLSKVSSEAARDASIASRSQVDLSRKAMILEQRPWLSIEPFLESGLSLDNDGNVRCTFTFEVRNHGKTPAVSVDIIPRLMIIFGNYDDILNHAHSGISKNDEPILDKEKPTVRLGATLFPGESLRQGYRVALSKSEIQQWRENFIKDFPEQQKSPDIFLNLSLVYKVDYKTTFSSERHQTTQCLMIRKLDPSKPHLDFLFQYGDLPANQSSVVLRASPLTVAPS